MIESFVMPLVLCFLRISAFVAFLPPFSGANLPGTVKVGLVMALTVFWLPGVMDAQREAATSKAQASVDADELSLTTLHSAAEDRSWLLWIWLGSREILLGMTLAWLLGTIMIPLRIAGSWLAEEIGLNIASITSAADTGSGNVIAVMLEALGVLLLYSMNLHHGFLLLFDRFFRDYQVGQSWQLPSMAVLIGMLTRIPEQGLAIAAPLSVVFLIIVLVLLFSMKQSPQFNLMNFGMPFRLAAGLLAMIMMFPDLLMNMTGHLQGFLNRAP